MSRREPPAVPPDDPLAHDPRLRAALRHAPDADLAPPPALSAAISAAAHAALRAAAPPPKLAPHQRLWRALQVFWDDLSAPRPVWAGGAAAVVVAGLTMSLWINEQTPPAVVSEAPSPAPRELAPETARQIAKAPAAVVAVPSPVPAPAPAPAAMPAPAAAVPAPPAAEPAPAKPDQATPQAVDAAIAKRARSADALADRDAKQVPEPEAKAKAAKAEQAKDQLQAERGARPQPATPREQDTAGEFAAQSALTRGALRTTPGAAATGTTDARSAAAGAAATPAPSAGPAPVPPPPPSPAAAVAAPPPPAMSPPRPATANTGRAETAPTDKPAALAKAAPTPFPAAPTMPIAPPAPAPAAAPPVVTEQRRLAEALPGIGPRSDASATATAPARGGQASNASTDNRAAMKLAIPSDRPPTLSALLGPNASSLTEAERSALQVLDGLTRQRWQRQPGAASEREAQPRQPFAPSTGLRGLRIEPDGVHWTEPDGSQWFAPLDPAAVTRLRGLF